MSMMIMKPTYKNIFILLFLIWAAITSPFSQALVSTGPTPTNGYTAIPTNEIRGVVDLLNAFRREPRRCGHITFPAIKSTTLSPEENAIATALEQAEDRGIDDVLNQDFKEILDQKITESRVAYVAGGRAIELLAVSYQDKSALEALSAWANLTNCRMIMTIAKSVFGGVGMGKYVRETEAGKKYYWVFILFEKYPVKQIPPASRPVILSEGVLISDNPTVNDSIVLTEKPLYKLNLTEKNSDLAVTQFKTIGQVRKVDQNTHQVTVRVVVENKGIGIAGNFRIGIWANDSSREMMVPFSVREQKNTWKPMTSSTLNSVESTIVEGIITFNPTQTGQSIDLYAVADDCRDDLVRSQGHCNVAESNEDNNESRPIRINNPHGSLIRLTAPSMLTQH